MLSEIAAVLTERLPGVNLQEYLTTAGAEERRKIGHQLGELLVRLSGMPFLTFGEFSTAIRIARCLV